MTWHESPRDGFGVLLGSSLLLAVAASERFCYDCTQTRHSRSDRILFSFSFCRLMPAMALAPPASPPLFLFLLSRPRLRSLRLLIISFIITCQMTCMYLLCDLQKTPLTLLSPAATALCSDMSLYPPCTCPYIQVILVYRTPNPPFINPLEAVRKCDKGNSVCPDIFRPCQLFRQHQCCFPPHTRPAL